MMIMIMMLRSEDDDVEDDGWGLMIKDWGWMIEDEDMNKGRRKYRISQDKDDIIPIMI